ncbi:hypothetical protein BX666DRAFT_1987047 [Dichotomocladium elegans]|nr:hypothetical protein BX666DRAFT_1987047 [Dichotomocladium elegans]
MEQVQELIKLRRYQQLRQIHNDDRVSIEIQKMQKQKESLQEKDETIARLRELYDHLCRRLSNVVLIEQSSIVERIGVFGLEAFDRRIPLAWENHETDDDDMTQASATPIRDRLLRMAHHNHPSSPDFSSQECPSRFDHRSPEQDGNTFTGAQQCAYRRASCADGRSSVTEEEQPYVEAVRTKRERAQLKGEACSCCEKFYHATGALPGFNGELITPEERIQQSSRHRTRFQRPKTPPGFWDLDFIPSQHAANEDSSPHRHLPNSLSQ